MAPVDRQKELLYQAQIEAFSTTTLHMRLNKAESAGMVQTLFNIARERTYWKSPLVPAVEFALTIEDDSAWGSAAQAMWYVDSYDGARITFTKTGQRPWIVVHEVCHILLQAGRRKHMDLEGHGPEYAAVFVWGIRTLFGKKWSNRLKREFVNLHVESISSLQED